MGNNVIYLKDITEEIIEQSEKALDKRNYPKARELFDKAYRLHNMGGNNPFIDNRLHNLENDLFYR